jgi:hypothetical protein
MSMEVLQIGHRLVAVIIFIVKEHIGLHLTRNMRGALLNGDLTSIILMIGLEFLGPKFGRGRFVFPTIVLFKKNYLFHVTKKGLSPYAIALLFQFPLQVLPS